MLQTPPYSELALMHVMKAVLFGWLKGKFWKVVSPRPEVKRWIRKEMLRKESVFTATRRN